ncbi:hypothetical protein AB1Y20_004401 [Prymnesium parvum]|uniref:Flavodoxin-like domain-containing protein n=1 Tax=Prymnesium parvum TaxID=97485 RepID=A0AB34IYB7_PRYPA
MGNSDGPPSYPVTDAICPFYIEKHSRVQTSFGISLHLVVDLDSDCRNQSPGILSEADTVAENPPVMPTKIAVVYYSMYGHIRQIALEVKKGLESAGCEVTFLKVPETLPDEVLAKMGAPGIGAEDEVATADKLTEYDGIMFGIPTRFGMAAAQMKAFMDSTGGLTGGRRRLRSPS